MFGVGVGVGYGFGVATPTRITTAAFTPELETRYTFYMRGVVFFIEVAFDLVLPQKRTN